MAKLSLPTETSVRPPLLIDASQLEALDQIVDRHIQRLTESADERIDKLTDQKTTFYLERGFYEEVDVEARRPDWRKDIATEEHLQRRAVTLYLSHGRDIQAERFSEAISQPVAHEVPLGFALNYSFGSIKVRVRLVSGWDNSLQIEVSPNDDEVAQQLFGALSNWAADIEAPRWQQTWRAYRGLFGFILWMWLLIGLVAIPFSNWGNAGQDQNKAEARKLLSQGVTPSNEQHAIALLLAIESDYDQGVKAPSLGAKYWSYFWLGALILIGACICPTVSIGAWKGKRQLSRWRAWVKAVSVTVPLLLAGSLVLPWILHFLGLNPPNP